MKMNFNILTLCMLLLSGLSSMAQARPIAFTPRNAQIVATQKLVIQANNPALFKKYIPEQPHCYGFVGDGNPGPIFERLNRQSKFINAEVQPVSVNDVVINVGTQLKVVDVTHESDVPFPDKFRGRDCKNLGLFAETQGTLTLETPEQVRIVINGFFFRRSYRTSPNGEDTMELEFLDLDTDDLERYLGLKFTFE